METLYITFVVIFGQTKIDTFCENAFWRTDINTHNQVIELCQEDVWKKSYPNSFNK